MQLMKKKWLNSLPCLKADPMATVTSSFAAVANSAPIAECTDIDVALNGTFVGSVQLQTATPGASGADAWVAVTGIAAQTAPGMVSYHGGVPRKYRLACTAYTSGAILYELSGSRLEDLNAN